MTCTPGRSPFTSPLFVFIFFLVCTKCHHEEELITTFGAQIYIYTQIIPPSSPSSCRRVFFPLKKKAKKSQHSCCFFWLTIESFLLGGVVLPVVVVLGCCKFSSSQHHITRNQTLVIANQSRLSIPNSKGSTWITPINRKFLSW